MRTVNNIEVGIRIRALRERHNLTREQLSEIVISALLKNSKAITIAATLKAILSF